jgi:hypothetical protein
MRFRHAGPRVGELRKQRRVVEQLGLVRRIELVEQLHGRLVERLRTRLVEGLRVAGQRSVAHWLGVVGRLGFFERVVERRRRHGAQRGIIEWVEQQRR